MEFWSSTLGDRWDLGVIAGTGVVGAVLYGEPKRHVAVLSHERFFIPANSRRAAPDLAPALPTVRAALAAGDEAGAAVAVEQCLRDLALDPDELIWTDPLGPIAQLVWQPDIDAFDDYRRVIRTDRLGAEVSWASARGAMGLRIRAEHGAEFMDVEVWSEGPARGILALEPVAERRVGANTVESLDYSAFAKEAFAVGPTELTAAIVADGDAIAVTAGLSLSSPRPMTAREHGWDVQLSAGEHLEFRLVVSTDGPGPRLVDVVPSSALGASQLTLDGASTGGHLESIWKSALSGEPAAELQVLQIAYAAGRRNIIASTGALPPTLQGVWQGTWSPAWSADYTMNGNVQLGTSAAVLWTGTPELMRSLFRLILQFSDDYRSNARALFAAPGMMLPARLSTHGHANHFVRDYPHQFWIGHGNWLLRMAADYIQVTGDDSIIDEWLWDYTVEILTFGLAVVEAADGHLSPSYSPENTPAGHDNPLAVDATADLAALRDGLRIGAWLARLRDEPNLAELWTSARGALPHYRVADDGCLAEWASATPEHLAHRHASQLHGLWYEPDEAFHQGPLRDAALATVRSKTAWRGEAPFGPPGHQEMAFGLSSIALAAANLGDAGSAYQCAIWLARDHFTRGLVSTHDAGAIFNLDASGALPAVVAAMLVRSSRSSIHLLPALPTPWEAGSITGLTARGGVIIHSLSWSPTGVSIDLELRPEAAWLRPPCTRIRLPKPGRIRTTPHVLQLDPTSIAIGTDAPRTTIIIDYPKPHRGTQDA